MKGRDARRSLLHVDLDAFLVSVERSLDPSLRGRPVVVGAGLVATASAEARARGVAAGQPLALARKLCPEAAFRPGDLEACARVSQDVTAVLQDASRRVERPSADEAFVDLGPEAARGRSPVPLAEAVKDELQRRLGLDASLGLAGSRLAARVASRWARPRGLLVVLPGYEAALLAREPVEALPDLPAHLLAALKKAGLETLGQLAESPDEALAAAVGAGVARRLRAEASGAADEPIPVSTPPAWVQEEAVVRSPAVDRPALEGLLDGLLARLLRRLRPFDLCAGSVTVEVRRGGGSARRSQDVEPGLRDEAAGHELLRSLAGPLLEPPAGVRALQLRLARFERPSPQAPLFPDRLRLFG